MHLYYNGIYSNTGYVKVAEVLIDIDGDVNRRNALKKTPLHFAVQKSKLFS